MSLSPKLVLDDKTGWLTAHSRLPAQVERSLSLFCA
jgi:hypothetical protein